MTREEGIAKVAEYSDRKPADLPLFLNWVGMSEQDFFDAIWNRRDENIWQKSTTDEWSLRDSIAYHAADEGVDAVRLDKTEDCNYRITPSAEPSTTDNEYLLMGRGYIDKYDYGALEDQPPGRMTPRTCQRKVIC